MTLSYDPPSAVNYSVSQKQKSIQLAGTDCTIQSQVSLAKGTSFRVGGPAEWYVAPRRVEDLQASVEWANAQKLPITLLGAGSNLLISDRGIPGLVICTRYLRYFQFDDQTGQVTASAGEPLPRLAWQAADRGWQGLEWSVGIPGTVGGAVVMNAGAHDRCTAELLVSTKVLSADGSIEVLTPEDLDYSYRTSILQRNPRLVLEATFQLQPGADPAEITAATHQDFEQRRLTQPYNYPSCGSVFRNPLPYHAAWLVEQTGLKGYQVGGAQVSNLHANFIINYDNATASDILQVMRHVQQQVKERWSVHLEPEVKMIGEF